MASKNCGMVLTAGVLALILFGFAQAPQAPQPAEAEEAGSSAGGFQGLFSDLLDFIHREFSFSKLLEPDSDEEKAAWERLEKYGPGSLAPEEKETLRKYRKSLEKRAAAFETVISRAEKKLDDFFRQIKKSLKTQRDQKLKLLRRVK